MRDLPSPRRRYAPASRKTTTACVKQGNAKRMTDYSLAFFRRHLMNTAEPLLQTKDAGLDSYQFKAGPAR